MAIPTAGTIPEGLRLSALLDEVVKKLKEGLPDKIEEIICIAFGLKEGGMIILVHPSPEAAKRGTLQVFYGRLGVAFRLPSHPDPEVLPKVLNILSEIVERGSQT